jgi:hypothetical protein
VSGFRESHRRGAPVALLTPLAVGALTVGPLAVGALTVGPLVLLVPLVLLALLALGVALVLIFDRDVPIG